MPGLVTAGKGAGGVAQPQGPAPRKRSRGNVCRALEGTLRLGPSRRPVGVERSRGNALRRDFPLPTLAGQSIGADLDDHEVAVLTGAVIGFRSETGAGHGDQGIGLALLEGRGGGDLGRRTGSPLRLVGLSRVASGGAACTDADGRECTGEIDTRRSTPSASAGSWPSRSIASSRAVTSSAPISAGRTARISTIPSSRTCQRASRTASWPRREPSTARKPEIVRAGCEAVIDRAWPRVVVRRTGAITCRHLPSASLTCRRPPPGGARSPGRGRAPDTRR
jgi:hypothetical protein